jgi:acyl transferase domain-containing protein/SAM-dependent methyltransferase
MTARPATDELSPLKRAIVELREMRARLDEAERARTEPIAVVGMGCRFPGGADDPESFWRLLRDGVDTVTEVPSSRWDLEAYYDADPDAPGKMYARHGSFLKDIDRFDPRFFGISPREAHNMDPQQRLLLEVAWEALEDAGQAAEKLLDSDTGVFVGIGTNDYANKGVDTGTLDAYFGSGNSMSAAAGRLSYVLGLQGPSVSLDTACSSSLVAVHLACQSLRNRECVLALVAGVNVVLNPYAHVIFCKARMLAPDGRCKTFDAAADGYVRGEGCGVVVLKRMSDAVLDRDRILAVIRGTAVNQDGRSGGLTVPNGLAQENLIRRALAASDLAPAEVSYVEAHGTGTALGDPIEMRALGSALGVDRPRDSPLVVGSVKTNLGHLESAAGVAGLIKVVLALQHGEIPPHLHFHDPNPHIRWSELPVTVPTALMPWPAAYDRRIAGISSFGFTGTNAHVIVEAAPTPVATPAEARRPLHLTALSARSAPALISVAERLADHLASTPASSLADVAFSANTGRSHFTHRLAVVAETADETRERLRAVAAGVPDVAGVTRGRLHGSERPDVAFLFTGQGSQYAGMGQRLFEGQPVFRRAMLRCEDLLRPLLERPLCSVLYPEAGKPTPLDETQYAQPALFAVEYALSEVWRSWGLEPAAVLGHSIGAYVAACVAGVFSWEDALTLVAARGRLMQGLPAGGEMAAVSADASRVRAAIDAQGAGVALAALNGPDDTVISGPGTSVRAVCAALAAEGIRSEPLAVSHAFHSGLMDPVLPAFESEARRAVFAQPRLTLVSDLTGRLAGEEVASPGYWRRHLREPVQFAAGMAALQGLGSTAYVEIGPRPVLLALGQRCLPEASSAWLPSLRRGRDDWSQMLESLARLYTLGAPVDWNGFDREGSRRKVVLPTYPFERERYWVEERKEEVGHAHARAFDHATAAGRRQARQAPFGLDLAAQPKRLAFLELLTTAYVAAALRRLGVYGEAGEACSVEDLRERAGILPIYGKLVTRWLRQLAKGGLLREEGERFVADAPLSTPAPETLWAAAESSGEEPPVLRDYVERCGSMLADVVTGKESPLETLFPGGRFDVAEALYEASPAASYVNEIAAAVVAAAGAALAGPQKLRILEIGAGTGGTTSALLPALLPEHTEYVFTDVSEVFLARARTKLGAFPFVRYGLLDIGRSPAEQGYPAGGFDIVVAANVIHATADLGLALDYARSLLTPGGLLLLSETTAHPAWLDITTGLIEGWQQFDDEIRRSSPLLPAAAWKELLQDHGFVDFVALPEAGSPAEVLGLHVLVARTPVSGAAKTVRSALLLPDRDVPAGAATLASEAAQRAAELRAQIEDAPPGQGEEILLEFVRDTVVQVLRLPPSQSVDSRHRLMDLGFDSLMAVELRDRLATGLGLTRKLPATLVFDHPSIEDIASYLAGDVLERSSSPSANVPPETTVPASSAAAALAQLSEEEAEALLLQRLEGLER